MGTLEDDWRLSRGGEPHLKGVALYWWQYKMPKPSWDHDHCSFCFERFGETDEDMREGWTTIDNYYWVCPTCLQDFQETFGWELHPDG